MPRNRSLGQGSRERPSGCRADVAEPHCQADAGAAEFIGQAASGLRGYGISPMGHPAIENKTPFAFEVLFLVDEEFRPLVVPVIKGTFEIRDARCHLAEKQLPVNVSGEHWGEDPETSSYKYEPEVAFFKPATDVVLVGQAYAPGGRAMEMDVTLAVGPLRKALKVFGERQWFAVAGGAAMSRPVPFATMPLVYERAFGGWDTRHPDPARHACELRNPAGVGFSLSYLDGLRLPNIEDPRALIRGPGDRPLPAGVGFVSPHWHPRAPLAGTYDANWQAHRAPLLATDFDRRHLNAASPGLVAPRYLRGGERVVAEGVSPDGLLAFTLPVVSPPGIKIVRKDAPDLDMTTNLDTVILEPDEGRVQLLWRAHGALRTGPHDLVAVAIS
jgi:hypothetical protein